MDTIYNQEEMTSTPPDDQFVGVEQAQNIDQEQKVELYRKYLYFNRSHNLLATRFSYQSLVDPVMIVMLNHFYNAEIRNTEFNNLDLELSLEKIVFSFNDFKINNL